jgi:GT2 family glycosyltransferase
MAKDNILTMPEQPPSILQPEGLVSILIPCCGQLEYTKLCVPSVLQHSRKPFEIIFLDIGSLDGTTEYLAGIQAAASHVHIEVIRTPTDLKITEAVDEALDAANGDYLVLLNNDTIVTNGWLQQLTGLARMSDGIGMVGPMSNYAAPPQLVELVPYRIGPRKGALAGSGRARGLVDTGAVQRFAQELREQNKGKWVTTERLGGFCLLLKRQLLRQISLRDWSDLRLFDTDILSVKAQQAGFQLAVCRDLFVHHFGTRSFAHGAPKPDAEVTRREPQTATT